MKEKYTAAEAIAYEQLEFMHSILFSVSGGLEKLRSTCRNKGNEKLSGRMEKLNSSVLRCSMECHEIHSEIRRKTYA